jgi:hypothetical protein
MIQMNLVREFMTPHEVKIRQNLMYDRVLSEIWDAIYEKLQSCKTDEELIFEKERVFEVHGYKKTFSFSPLQFHFYTVKSGRTYTYNLQDRDVKMSMLTRDDKIILQFKPLIDELISK